MPALCPATPRRRRPQLPGTADYRSPFRFTGTLHSVTVDLSGDPSTDSASERRMAMARQ